MRPVASKVTQLIQSPHVCSLLSVFHLFCECPRRFYFANNNCQNLKFIDEQNWLRHTIKDYRYSGCANNLITRAKVCIFPFQKLIMTMCINILPDSCVCLLLKIPMKYNEVYVCNMTKHEKEYEYCNVLVMLFHSYCEPSELHWCLAPGYQ